VNSRYIVVSGAIFGFMALAQFLRAAFQVPVEVGGVDIPVWASWIAVVVAGTLCTWAFASRNKGQ
jgi:hypothetical protein